MSNYFDKLPSPRTAERTRRRTNSITPSPPLSQFAAGHRANQDTDTEALFFADPSQPDPMVKGPHHHSAEYHRRRRNHPYASPPRSQPQSQRHSLGQIPTSPVGQSKNDVHVHFKTEAEQESISRIPIDERVSIFVGQHNQIFTVSLESLDKSPVLKSLVSRQGGEYNGGSKININSSRSGSGTGAEGTFIMHPKLTSIEPDHFAAVQQFLLADEYIPAIVSNYAGEDDSSDKSVLLPKTLDGVDSPQDYRSETIRAAHLYVLAKRLGMASMGQLVKRKITECGYATASVGVKCLLDVSMVVFSRPDDADGGMQVVQQSSTPNHSQGANANKRKRNNHNSNTNAKDQLYNGRSDDTDALEEWLIGVLATRFQAMMISHAQLFFRVAGHGAAVRRQFQRRILERRMEALKTLGDAVLIEDDE